MSTQIRTLEEPFIFPPDGKGIGGVWRRARAQSGYTLVCLRSLCRQPRRWSLKTRTWPARRAIPSRSTSMSSTSGGNSRRRLAPCPTDERRGSSTVLACAGAAQLGARRLSRSPPCRALLWPGYCSRRSPHSVNSCGTCLHVLVVARCAGK